MAWRARQAVTRPELELRFLAFLEHHHLPRPSINATIDLPDKPRTVDCLWPAQRLIAELDGFATHGTRKAFEDDRALQVAGYRTIRITWRHLADDAATLANEIATVLAHASDHASPSSLDQRMISTNQFKNGNHIEVDGTVFKILEFQHVKPGKGGAFVRSKLRRAADGAVIDRTFRAGEKFRAVRTEARKMQFLYADGTDAHFMDNESYEQMAVPESTVAEALKWTKPNETVDVLFIDGNPSDLQLPASVELEVTETEPGLRGDTASGGGNKPATLETGATINVPLFVDVGQRVKVDTRSGQYMSRA
jgi:elongation factor P